MFSTIQKGWLQYNQRKYQKIFLTQVESLEPATAKKLFDFIQSGGRVFFIEAFPSKSTGWKDHEQRDQEVQHWVTEMKSYSSRCIFLNKPGKDHTQWYKIIRQEHSIKPYIEIDSPDKFVSQVRYQAKDMELILFTNSNMHAPYEITVTPSSDVSSGKQCWIWDPENGERHKIANNPNRINIDLGPADLKLLVFDKEKKGPSYPAIRTKENAISLGNSWSVTGQHIDGTVVKKEMDHLEDLKEIPDWINFCGSIIYKTNLVVEDKSKIDWLNPGRVYGTSELFINGQNAGSRWFGRRIYRIGEFLKNGKNSIEIKVTTTMGNYLKSLKDNRIAQYWTNEGRTIQPVQSVGLAGPVTVY